VTPENGNESSQAEWVECGPLSIRSKRNPEELWVIDLYGDLDRSAARLLRRFLLLAEATDVHRIVVDLSGLDSIDYVGIAALYEAQARSRLDSNRLTFLRGAGQVEEALSSMSPDSALDFAD
jgi:anti-anti-sigma factor